MIRPLNCWKSLRVSKLFSGVQALDDVSLTLARGEVLAVIGENGAGKSTLMKIVAGVHYAESGKIRVDGNPVAIDSVAQTTRTGRLAHPSGAQFVG